MVRIDETTWIKAGIELSDGAACLGSVLTVERSDWSTSVCASDPSDFYLHVTVKGGVLRLQSSTDGVHCPCCGCAHFQPRPPTMSVPCSGRGNRATHVTVEAYGG